MILLDTHAWLWWATGDGRLSRAGARAVAHDQVGISAMSCLEIARLAARGRITLDRDPRLWIQQALAPASVTAIPVDAGIAVAAGLLDEAAFPGDPTDRIIYATARAVGAILVTKDRRLRAFDPAGTLW